MTLQAEWAHWRLARVRSKAGSRFRAGIRANIRWTSFALGVAVCSALAVARPDRSQLGGQREPSQAGRRSQPANPKPDLNHGRPVARPKPAPLPGQVRLNPGKGPPISSGKSPPEYSFRAGDRALLLRYYRRRLRYVNPARRPHFSAGGFIPQGDLRYLTPLAPGLRRLLPPPSAGRRLSYFDGYVVAYDPKTRFIAAVIDLLG